MQSDEKIAATTAIFQGLHRIAELNIDEKAVAIEDKVLTVLETGVGAVRSEVLSAQEAARDAKGEVERVRQECHDNLEFLYEMICTLRTQMTRMQGMAIPTGTLRASELLMKPLVLRDLTNACERPCKWSVRSASTRSSGE